MYLLDTADTEAIKRLMDRYRIEGVTTNPTILKKTDPKDVYRHLAKLRDLIAPRALYVQVTGANYDAMREEAYALRRHLQKDGFPAFIMKIPATADGFRLMKEGGEVLPFAATAVFNFHQAIMAANMQAESVIVYVDRMERESKDPYSLITDIRAHFDGMKTVTRILAASLKEPSQVEKAFMAGTHKVTVTTALAEELFRDEQSINADAAFRADWEEIKKSSR